MQLTPEQQELSDQQVARVKERAANSPKPVVKEEEVVPVEGGGGLLWNGQLVQPGALEGSFRNEAVQQPSGVPSELTRGRGPVRPDQSKNLDHLVRHPVTGKLVNPEDLPK